MLTEPLLLNAPAIMQFRDELKLESHGSAHTLWTRALAPRAGMIGTATSISQDAS